MLIEINIKISLLDTPKALARNEGTKTNATITLKDKQLTVVPQSAGIHTFTLAAESNGRVVSKTVTVNVSDRLSGINNIDYTPQSIICDGKRIYVNGFNGDNFTIYDLAGRSVASFPVDADRYILDFGGHQGIFVLKAGSNFSTKVIIKK